MERQPGRVIGDDLTYGPLDVTQGTLRFILATVPGLGGFAEILAEVQGAAQLRLFRTWFQELADQIEGLRWSLHEIEANSRLNTAIIRASLIASRTHVAETRAALLNGVVSVADSDLDDDVTHMFFSQIEELTPTHIKTLRYLDNVQEPAGRHQIMEGLDRKLPEVARRGLRQKVLYDLQRAGFVGPSAVPPLGSGVVVAGGDQIDKGDLVTPFGKEFLEFISSRRTARGAEGGAEGGMATH